MLIIKDSTTYLIVSLITASLAFLTLPIYTKYLNPYDYGIIALFLLFANISSGLLSIGLHKATYRYYFKYRLNLNFFTKINSSNILFLFFIFILSGVFVHFTSSLISHKLFNNKITPLLIELSFISGFFQYLFIYFTNLLNAQERIKTFAFFTILKPVLDIFISMFLIFNNSLTYLAKIYGHFFSQIITVSILLIIFIKMIELKFSFQVFKKSFKFSIPQLPQNLLGLAHQSFDKMMLANYSTLASLAHYSFGSNFAMPIKMIMDAFARSWNPSFLKKAEESNGILNQIEKPFYFMISMIFIIGLSLSFFSEELVFLLTEESFHFSKYIIPGYVFYYLIGSIGFISLPQMMYAEKMIYTIPVTATNILINLTLNFILIPMYGSIGAMISIFTSAFVASFVQFYFGQKSMYLEINKIKLISFLSIFIFFFIFSYFLMFIELHLMIKIIIKLLLISIYIFLLYSLKYFNYKYMLRL